MSRSGDAKKRRWAAALTLLGLGAASLGCAAKEPPPPREALATRVDQLRAELAIARAGHFYLRLDPGRRVIELLLGGVVLESYPVLATEKGTPRVAFWSREAPDGWDRVAYLGGALEPARERDRLEIVAPVAGGPRSDDGASPPPIPATAEESVSVPSRWRVEFARGLSLEVLARDGARHRSLGRRAADRLALWRADWRWAIGDRASERVWLRVRLAAEDAAALYRSLPPDVGLVIRSGGPA